MCRCARSPSRLAVDITGSVGLDCICILRGHASRLALQLDEALDLNGNIFWGAMGSCCIGCATWHRCFNLMPRCRRCCIRAQRPQPVLVHKRAEVDHTEQAAVQTKFA